MYKKKLFDSDWLRAVQFKRNTNAKSVTQKVLHIGILDYDWLKVKRRFSKPVTLMCTCEFFKKQKLHSPKQLKQFQLFEKLTSVH